MVSFGTPTLIFAIVAGVPFYVHFLGFTGMPAAIANWIILLVPMTMMK